MAIRASRIVWVSTGLMAVVLLSLWWNARERPTPIDPNDAPWIGLPSSGMDATGQPTRALFRRVFAFDPSSEPLAIRCGIHGDEAPYAGKEKDRYVAHIGENAFHPSWKIVMDVDGNDIDIRWGYENIPPPPPLGDRRPIRVEPVSMTRKSRAEMESIRKVWNDQALWHAPQDAQAFACLDGDPVLLEACVNGQYAARSRNCNEQAMKATVKLWQAFNRVLPPPHDVEWRDAAGNLISDPSGH